LILICSNIQTASSSTQYEQLLGEPIDMSMVTSENDIKQSSNNKIKMPRRIRAVSHGNVNRWNTSTHVKGNPYLPGLTDAYPRDPFTKMPPKCDNLEMYRLLQSRSSLFKSCNRTHIHACMHSFVFCSHLAMTMADVKKFLNSRQEQLSSSKMSTASDERQEQEQQRRRRPVVFAACHVDDIQTLRKPKKGEESFRPLRYFDESGLHMTNNARKSVFFQQLSYAMANEENKSLSQRQIEETNAKWAVFNQYGSELVEFLTDRRGALKKEYDKVFIT
jgi:hypothetical protein